MTLQLSDRIERMSESTTIRMSKLSRELKASGKEVINLSVGEPDFQTPDHIREAAIQAVRDGYSHYSPVGGYNDLKDAIVKKFSDDNELTYSRNEVMVSNGAKHCLINTLLALVNPGDEVLTPVPYWVSYPEMIKLAEGIMVPLATDASTDFKITPEQLESAITDKTRMLIFNAPSNPSGAVYTKEETAAIARVLEQHPQVLIISDEIYEYINFQGGHYSLAQFEGLKDRTVVINGVSKCYAMTGWRIGYMGAVPEIISACEKLQGQFTSGPNAVAQRAALAALSGGNESAIEMRDAFLKRRDLLGSELEKIEDFKISIPGGAFYFFPEVSRLFGKKYGDHLIEDAETLSMYLLEEAGVSVVPGEAFGNPDCIRISYAASEEELMKGVSAIKKALKV